jgi:hypothetical protein
MVNLKITKERLQALENGGVDNWDFYGESLSEFHKAEEIEAELDSLMEDVEAALLQGVYEPSERGAGFCATDDAREEAKDVILEFIKKQIKS